MDQTQQQLLIIFYRNPKTGPVKTRLAATIGAPRAHEIFRKLAQHTRQVTEALPCEKIVFYTDAIDLMDEWPNKDYLKALQYGEDLGARMRHAFAAGFESGYNAICIIGTDCYEISEAIILEAFEALQTSDAVIGPARDGGYYLLGMKQPHPEIFYNKAWSTHSVLCETLKDFERSGLTYHTLPVLRDVDVEDDLPDAWRQ